MGCVARARRSEGNQPTRRLLTRSWGTWTGPRQASTDRLSATLVSSELATPFEAGCTPFPKPSISFYFLRKMACVLFRRKLRSQFSFRRIEFLAFSCKYQSARKSTPQTKENTRYNIYITILLLLSYYLYPLPFPPPLPGGGGLLGVLGGYIGGENN